VIYKKKAP